MSSKKPRKGSNSRLPFFAGAKSDVVDMSFWQLVMMIYPHSRDDLARGLVGETMMPLQGLLHGAPPACNSIRVELVLWQSAFDGQHPGNYVSYERLITAAAHDFTLDRLATLRGSLPENASPEHFSRVDYWAGMLGDVYAAKRIQTDYGHTAGLVRYFVDALVEYAEMLTGRKGDRPAYQPGLGNHLLVRAAQRSISGLDRVLIDLNDINDWGKARRSEAHDASQEVLVNHRDFLSQTLVDAAREYLTDQREEDEMASIRARELDQKRPGSAFTTLLFQSWQRRVAAGEQVSDGDCRAAAEEVISRWEHDQDRQVNIDTREMSEVMKVLESEVDRLAIEKIRTGQKTKVEELAKLPKEERSKQAGKAEIHGLGPIAALQAAQALSDASTFEDDIDELGAAIAEAETKRTSVQVLPHIDVTGYKPDAGDILHQAAKLGGSYIEQHVALEIPESRRDLVSAWPHAVEVIDRLLSDLVDGQPVAFRPTILVGAPGSGKTSLLRSIAEALYVPHLVYGCAGVCDSSFAGTSAQWGSKRLSVPLELIRQTGRSNPLVILDELEKTGAYGNGGRLHDALLPLLESHSAAAFFETGIERKSDLSHVSYLATANSLENIPAPLRDRFRVIQMPDAGPQHIGDLAAGILGRIISERGLDKSWTPPLQHDEVEIIRRAWPGGSLRRLRRAVEATLDAREAVLRQQVM